MYLFSGGLVAIALFCQAGYAWINPYIPEYYMVCFIDGQTVDIILNKQS